MRIVEWAEFQTLPQGTVYQKINKDGGMMQEPEIFGGASEGLNGGPSNSYTYANLLPQIESISCLGRFAPENLKDYHGDVITQPSGFARYGYYDLNDPKENHRWLIWEEADCKRLAGWLLNPEVAVDLQNEDDNIVCLLPYVE